jgi:Rhodopirellula transposase DDE domain
MAILGGGESFGHVRLPPNRAPPRYDDPGFRTRFAARDLARRDWNKIEHRLFSHISMNWRGRPLTSHDVIVQAIAAATTHTGLNVHAELDTGTYPTGVKIPDSQMTALSDTGVLRRHEWHPEWNYNLSPPSQ